MNLQTCINGDENPQKTRLSTSLVLEDIFSDYRPKEYLNDVEKKCEKNKDCKRDYLSLPILARIILQERRMAEFSYDFDCFHIIDSAEQPSGSIWRIYPCKDQ